MSSIRLGRYILKKWLGGGRFGDVYLAEDTLLGKDFALKVMRVKGNTDALLEEAKTLARLEHPNIVRFYTIDIINDRLVMATEFVEGKSLRKLIDREAPFSQERAVFYAEQLLSALNHAHENGIIHRDVKPENIIITPGGRVKLLDFGLARLFEKDLSMSMGGTPLYMAPESWKGEFSRLSDQWSCGVILAEMLLGYHPFVSHSLEELREKITSRPVCLGGEFDEHLVEAVERATQPEPSHRFDSCREFARSISGGKSKLTILIPSSERKIDILNQLTEEQRDAVEEKWRRVLVLGGPGTGKTLTLTARAVYLMEKGVRGDSILITTFNVRGCREIEARLSKYMGKASEDLWLGNLHQIAFRILSRFGALIGLPEEITLVPPAMRGELAKEIAKKITFTIASPEHVIKEVLNRFHVSRMHLEGKEEFLSRASGRWRGLLEEFWHVYHETVLKTGKLDYDDLIYLCAMLLKEHPQVVEFYRERIKHLLVDEVQDLNPAQIYIIETLGRDGHLFLTGDDDQSIYQWRGATPSYIRSIKKREDFKVFKLTKSFRLPTQIRDAACNLIQFNRVRIPKVFWSEREGDRFYIDVKALKTPGDEAEFVCDIVEILRVKEGYSYSDFCVLYRTNARGRLLEQTFKRRKLPYSHQFGKSLYTREEALFAVDLLKYAASPGPGILKRLRARAYILGKKGDEGKRLLEELTERVKGFKKPSEVLSELARHLGRVGMQSEEGHAIARLTSVEEILLQAKDFEARSKSPSIRAFLNHIRFMVSSGLAEEDEGVRLLSVHSAKGLEFPVVFLVGMVEGEFPLSRAMGVEEEMEEERRLCYTAITRATEKLFITYYRFSSRYTRFEEKPSRFIKEMLGI